jgi:C1A family cysteine protease
MKSEKGGGFGKTLIFTVIFATLAFLSISIGCVSAESSFITDTKINDDDPQGGDSATCANFDYWMETFSIQAGDLKKVIIDKNFFQDEEVYPFNRTEIIYGLTLSGAIQLNGATSLIRVILVDNDFNEYLVYEAYPLIVTNNSFSVTNVCEETCLLDSITPYLLKVEVIDASIHIDELSYTDSLEGGIIDIAELQKQIKETQNAAKIKEINNQIKKKGLKWIAGETSVSRLFYEEKKKLFGKDKVPNLQGAEYYKGGILEIKSGETSPSLSTDSGSSSLIESFDWRNRHGANNPNSPYYDGDPNGSGWITPVKSQGCNHCWAFTPLHATEAIVNLYFNQHLDLDLSEQDVASCNGGNVGCCQGGYVSTALNYIIDTGVVDEECFPYSASCESCANKCSNPNEQIKISGRLYSGYDEEDIKRAIIDYGPITGGISSWWHAMVMVGFDKDPDDGETIWIFKNSWGTGWGDNGYGYLKVELNDLTNKYALLTPVTSLETPYEIACYDKDGDEYYNWGISENKPISCPDCPSEKDCDDSNPCLGPFDPDGYCIVICTTKADFTADPISGETPLTVNFTDQSTGDIIDWFWDFGDGDTSTEQNPPHTYNSTGDFTVSLTVTGPSGSDTETKENYIHVTEVVTPHPDIKATGSDGPIILNQSDTLTITVALDNNGPTDDADWWLAAQTPFGLYFYTFSGWVSYEVPLHQGPLFYLGEYELFSTSCSGLQAGTYTFYFGVDTDMNGLITWDSVYYDTTLVTIESGVTTFGP